MPPTQLSLAKCWECLRLHGGHATKTKCGGQVGDRLWLEHLAAPKQRTVCPQSHGRGLRNETESFASQSFRAGPPLPTAWHSEATPVFPYLPSCLGNPCSSSELHLYGPRLAFCLPMSNFSPCGNPSSQSDSLGSSHHKGFEAFPFLPLCHR